MNKQTKETLMDIAAEIVVSPLTLYAKFSELKAEFDASLVGEQTNRKISEAKETVNKKAKEVSEKVSETEAAKRAKAAYETVKENAGEVKEKVSSIFAKEDVVEEEFSEEVQTEEKEETEETEEEAQPEEE